MKQILTVLFTLFCLHQGFAQTNPLVQDIINKVNIDSLTQNVNELSGEVPVIINGQTITITTRYYSSSTNDKAADYVKQKFESYGLQAYNQTFSWGRNVYAVQTGTTHPDQYYIICAHYDDMPSSGLAPGADDNGSGTVAVVEAARVLKDYTFDYSIIYAVWDAEEMGLIGSDYYAQQAYSSGMNIQGVLNMDMIAWDGNGDNKAEIHTKNIANSIALKDSMLAINTGYNVGITTSVINPGLTASDHASFWNYNYSAILLIENYYGDFNPYYHTSNDLIDHYNFPYFEKCSKLTIGTLALLAKVEDVTPVELTNFIAVSNGANVKLNWETASEKNNQGFEIERQLSSKQSSAGNWKKIGFVSGHGTTTEKNDYSYSDKNLSNGAYTYRLKQIDYDGSFEYSKQVEVQVNTITTFALDQNYPNPFNPTTNIKFRIANPGFVSLKVYDVLGNEISTLVNKQKDAGSYQVKFDAGNIPSGVYLYQLKTNSEVISKKMMILK